MKRTLIFRLLAMAFPLIKLPAYAETNAPALGEIIAGLKSANPDTRMVAISRGLKSGDHTIRALAVRYSLKDNTSLHLTLSGSRGDDSAADFLANMPNFDIFNIRWNNDGRELNGEFSSKGRVATGNINGEALSIGIRFVEIRIPNSGVRVSTCNTTMTLNSARDALEGNFRCSGIAYHFIASVPL